MLLMARRSCVGFSILMLVGLARRAILPGSVIDGLGGAILPDFDVDVVY